MTTFFPPGSASGQLPTTAEASGHSCRIYLTNSKRHRTGSLQLKPEIPGYGGDHRKQIQLYRLCLPWIILLRTE